MCPLHVLMWDSVIQCNPVKCCRYLWLLFCPVGERYSVMRTHKNHLLSLSPESSWFKSLSTSMNKCINVHLHLHSTLTRCLPPSPTISEWLCHKPVKWGVTEPTNRCREKYGRTTAVRRNRSETSLSRVSSRSVTWTAETAETHWIIEAEPTRLNLSTHKQQLYPWPWGTRGMMTDSIWHGFNHRKYQRNSKKRRGLLTLIDGGTKMCEKQQHECNTTRMRLLELQSIAIRLATRVSHAWRHRCEMIWAQEWKRISSIDSMNIMTERPKPNFPWIHRIVIWFSYGSTRNIKMENTLKFEPELEHCSRPDTFMWTLGMA